MVREALVLRSVERVEAPSGMGGHHRRRDIEGLRAVAVGLVVLAHCGVRTFAGGYVGVDVFFVISGFLITSLLLREVAESGRVSVRAFYARRALRLLPASLLALVATLAAAWAWSSPARFHGYVGDALSSALYVVNFRLAATGTDYLAQGSPPSPFQHFWSLAVEEQFYLGWPLLIVGVWWATRLRAALAGVLLLVCAGSFALSVAQTGSSAPWAYFGSQARVWELGVGALLAVVGTERLRGIPAAVAGWAGLGAIGLAAVTFDDDTAFPGWLAALPVLGAALVIAGGTGAGAADRRGAGRVLGVGPMVWLGGLSYGWYLWHWPFVLIGPEALGMRASVGLRLVLAGCALGVAVVTLRLVENPVRFHRLLKGRPGRGLGVGALLSGGAVVCCLVAFAVPPAVAVGPPAADLVARLAAAGDPEKALRAELERPGTVLPRNLKPALDRVRLDRSAVYREGCHINYATVAIPDDCVYGDVRADRTVVLFGDSHAAQWFPALEAIARREHWKLVSITKASCKTAKVTVLHEKKPYTNCDTWRADAVAKIGEMRPALVVTGASDAGEPVSPGPDPVRLWTDGFRETFAALAATGAKTVAIQDTPWPAADAPDCVAENPRTLLVHCVNRRTAAVQDPSRHDALAGAAKATGTTVIDPASWLCAPGGGCPSVVADTLVYRDDSHLSERYAEALAPLLERRLPSF